MTSDTIYQDGPFGFLFKASGTIERGQAVRIIDNNYVTATSVGDNGIGINDHKSLHNNEVTIYIPGNIVRACGTEAYTPGTILYASSNGLLCNQRYASERPMAIVRSTFEDATTNKVGKVILI